MKTIELLTASRRALLKEVARLNRRASKLGLSDITVELLGARTVDRVRVWTDDEGNQGEDRYPVDVDAVRLTLPDAGDYKWSLLATLTKLDGEHGLFVEPHVPGFDASPWRASSPQRCDHCHANRERRNLFVVRHNETAEVRQVGRTCFADYVGQDGLLKLEFLAVVFTSFSCDEDDGIWGSGRGGSADLVEPRAVIALAEIKAELDGRWNNNVKNEWGDLITDGTHRIAAKWARGQYEIPVEVQKRAGDESDPIWAKVDAAIERFADLTELDEFGQSLQQCLSYPFVPSQKAGLVAYAGQFLRSRDARAEAAAKAESSRHVGTVGKREVFSGLTVKRIIESDGMYGTSFYHVFEDASGNAVVWNASSDQGWDEGEVVSLKGTVKQHAEYRGGPQTVLTRCKALD